MLWSVALQEAAVRYQELKAEQETREAQEIERNERKPPYYKEIKVKHQFVGIVKASVIHICSWIDQ